MFGKENLFGGVLWGIVLSLVIGVVIALLLDVSLGSWVFILSLALLPGFFIMTLFYLYRFSREKIYKVGLKEGFDWGVEMNLRKIEIIHARYTSLIQTAGILATGSFLAMVFIVSKFPSWSTGDLIFFPLSTSLFIASIHFGFRWWLAMREDYKHLKFDRTWKNRP